MSRHALYNRAYSITGLLVTAISGLVALPILNAEFGISAVAVLGVFFLIQQWFVVLESSFNAEVSRATAAYASFTMSRKEWLGELRRQQNLLLWLALILVVVIISFGELASEVFWGNEANETDSGIFYLFSVALVVRTFSGLERAIYRGLQQFRKLAIISGVFMILRFPIAALFVSYFDQSLLIFALLQLIFVILELFVQKISSPIGFFVQTSLPKLTSFSKNNLLISCVGVASAQLDKLYLLVTATERDFALYSLGAQVAISISLLSRGVSNVALTEVAQAYDRGDTEEISRVINESIISLARAVIPAVIFVVIFAEDVLFLWMQDASLASAARHSTQLLCFTAALSAFNFYAYLTSNALRAFRAHTIFSFGFTFIFILALSANLMEDKLIYAALVAAMLNLASLIFYLPWSLGRIGYHGFNLISRDVLKIFLSATIAATSLSFALFYIPHVSYVVDLFIFMLVGLAYVFFVYRRWLVALLRHPIAWHE